MKWCSSSLTGGQPRADSHRTMTDSLLWGTRSDERRPARLQPGDVSLVSIRRRPLKISRLHSVRNRNDVQLIEGVLASESQLVQTSIVHMFDAR